MSRGSEIASPPREMMLFVCACCPNDAKAVALAEAIEMIAPGQAKSVDVNGWTPLFYSLFKCKNFKNGRRRFIQAPMLEKWLIEHGCNPRQKDKYGLSWVDLRFHLPGGRNVCRAGNEKCYNIEDGGDCTESQR